MSQVQNLKQQVQQASGVQNARTLVDMINENCFAKCVQKPGDSLSSTEANCTTACMEKYMQAWNTVSREYVGRLQREQASRGGATML